MAGCCPSAAGAAGRLAPLGTPPFRAFAGVPGAVCPADLAVTGCGAVPARISGAAAASSGVGESSVGAAWFAADGIGAAGNGRICIVCDAATGAVAVVTVSAGCSAAWPRPASRPVARAERGPTSPVVVGTAPVATSCVWAIPTRTCDFCCGTTTAPDAVFAPVLAVRADAFCSTAANPGVEATAVSEISPLCIRAEEVPVCATPDAATASLPAAGIAWGRIKASGVIAVGPGGLRAS
jgi:hypothetical protein